MGDTCYRARPSYHTKKFFSYAMIFKFVKSLNYYCKNQTAFALFKKKGKSCLIMHLNHINLGRVH